MIKISKQDKGGGCESLDQSDDVVLVNHNRRVDHGPEQEDQINLSMVGWIFKRFVVEFFPAR